MGAHKACSRRNAVKNAFEPVEDQNTKLFAARSGSPFVKSVYGLADASLTVREGKNSNDQQYENHQEKYLPETERMVAREGAGGAIHQHLIRLRAVIIRHEPNGQERM